MNRREKRIVLIGFGFVLPKECTKYIFKKSGGYFTWFLQK